MPALRRTLLVCTTLQMCQQLSGINAIVYFTPQILRDAGAPDILDADGSTSDIGAHGGPGGW